jgi:hypothetical protein
VVRVSSGVVFERRQDVVLSEHEWSVVLNFNLISLRHEYKMLTDLFSDMSERLGKMASGKLSESFVLSTKRMAVEYERVKGELEVLVDLLEKRRPKRGWINAGGHVLKTVFGTLDEDDLSSISRRILAVEREGASVRAELENQLVIVGNLEEAVTNNTRFIRSVVSELMVFKGGLERSLSNYGSQVSQLVREEDRLRQIGHVLVNARMDLVNLRQALENSVQGRLSSVLVPPDLLIKVLRRVREGIQLPLYMIAPCEHRSLHVYYEVVTVSAIVVGDQLRVVLRVPLGSKDSTFERYDIHSFPVYHESVKKHLEWSLGKALLISADRGYFAVWGSSGLETCGRGPVLICPARFALRGRSQAACEYNLFVSGSRKNCERSIRLLNEPFFKRVGHDWLFSLPAPRSVTFVCRNATHELAPVTKEMNGGGILKDAGNCDASGEDFRLMAVVHGNTVINSSLWGLVQPDVQVFDPKIDVHWEGDKRGLVTRLGILRAEIDKEMTAAGGNANFERVVARVLATVKESEAMAPSTGISLGVGTIVVMSMVVLAYRYRKRLIGCLGGRETPVIDASQVRVRVAQEGVNETMC